MSRWKKVLIAAALVIGFSFSLLQVDARGFPPRLFLARAKTVRAVFEAITAARAASYGVGSGMDVDDIEGSE